MTAADLSVFLACFVVLVCLQMEIRYFYQAISVIGFLLVSGLLYVVYGLWPPVMINIAAYLFIIIGSEELRREYTAVNDDLINGVTRIFRRRG